MFPQRCIVVMFFISALFVIAGASLAKAQIIPDQQVLLNENFDRLVAEKAPAQFRDDSAWAGGRVDLRIVKTDDNNKVLEAQTYGYAQIAMGWLNVQKEQSYRVSMLVTATGLQNLTVSLRQSGYPYRTYGEIEAQVNESPRRVIFLADKVRDTTLAHAQIIMRGHSTLTIDELKVETWDPARPIDEGFAASGQLVKEPPPRAGNLLSNASFEMGGGSWMARHPVEFRSDPAAFDGRNIATISPGGVLFSQWLELSCQREYIVSARVKARQAPAKVSLSLTDYTNFRPKPVGHSKSFDIKPEDDWQKISFRWQPLSRQGQISEYRRFYFHMNLAKTSAATVDVDCVEIKLADENADQFSLLWPKEYSLITNASSGVAVTGEPVELQLRGTHIASETVSTYIFDENDTLHTKISLTTKDGQASIILPPLPPGYWRITTRSPDEGPVASRVIGEPTAPWGETFLAVVPPMPEIPLDRWHFGTHVRIDANMRAACEKLGWRWNRLHDVSMITKWNSVQPSASSDWTFDLDAMKEFRQRQAVLGLLDGCPRWLIKKPGLDVSKMLIWHLPAHISDELMPAWEDYCYRTAQAFSKEIRWWEINNEPNLSGMSPEHYMKLAKAAWNGVKRADSSLKVLGMGGATPFETQWRKRVIQLGIHQYSDAISYHGYGPLMWSSAQGPDRLTAAIQDMRAQIKAAGGPDSMPIWDSESGLIIQSAYSKFYMPLGDYTPMEAANIFPKHVASVLASGLDRWFYYAAFELRNPGEGAAYGISDQGNTIKLSFQPMAVAIATLEGSRYLGQDQQAAQKGMIHLTFERNGKKIHMLWSSKSDVECALPSGTNRVMNMFGRDINPPATFKLGVSPIYCFE